MAKVVKMTKAELVEHINEFGEISEGIAIIEAALRRENSKLFARLDELNKRKGELCKLIKPQIPYDSIVQGSTWEAVNTPIRVLDPVKVRKLFKSEKVFLDYVTVKIKDLEKDFSGDTIDACVDQKAEESKVVIHIIPGRE